MIPANPGYNAYYKIDGKFHSLPVEAWDTDGHPMVVDDTGLVRAATLPGYTRVGCASEKTIIGVLPGAGWMVERGDGTREPLIGWTVYAHDVEAVFALPMVRDVEVGPDEPTQAWTHGDGEPVRVYPAVVEHVRPR